MSDPADASPARPATQHTLERNRQAAARLSFDDDADFARARRGKIASLETGRIGPSDRPVWDLTRYGFVDDGMEAPQTVHPGLWRQARLNGIHGLFEVAPGFYQARGYDLSNITFIRGQRGWVVVDPLTTAQTAAACLELANRHLGPRPVTGVIYTHSHVDHYGGVLGVTSREAVATGQVPILAPAGFLVEAVSENVIAGPAMGRRAIYQFGHLLVPGPRGHVDNGLGRALPFGHSGLLEPTEEIAQTGAERCVDGVRFLFQITPGTEAPAEMNFFFPDHGVLCMAENCTHNLHNLYPLRGAQARDALAWSKYIHEALRLFGAQSDVLFSTHHWPRFGRQDVATFLSRQRDVYRYIHDQTVRLANRGLTPTEIAEQIRLPPCFSNHSDVQGYYGTASHNAKAVYQRYLGFYDGNPANLDPLPTCEASRNYVEFMGGADAVLERAQECFERGEYRWVAQVVNHVVFAQPSHRGARELQAAALEQLGYQAESATWRNAYLMGAQELRWGTPDLPLQTAYGSLSAMTPEQLVDFIGVRFDAQAFGERELEINVTFTDLAEQHVLGISNSAVHHSPHVHSEHAALGLWLSRAALARLLAERSTLEEELAAGELRLEGDRALLEQLLTSLELGGRMFPIVEP